MDFHAEFFPRAFDKKINHRQKLLLVGSCFTEQVGGKLSQHKFNTLENPNGILFNPVSIANAVLSYISGKRYSEEDLFFHHELWGSWQHHTRFSHPEQEKVLEQINRSQERASAFLKDADWLMLTLGSAFVYERHDIDAGIDYGNVVANCHKVPADKFSRRLLSSAEVSAVLSSMLTALKTHNPSLNIIFTISPVRHLREGFIENNRSKAALIQAVHGLTDNDSIFYFPSYELVIDDLRDYRFYAEDMVHPNYAATNYVWQKFTAVSMDETTLQLMKEINTINAARSHKAFNPASGAHKKFMQSNMEKAIGLQEQHPYLDLNDDIRYFREGI